MVCFVLTSRCFAYRHAATTFYQLLRGFGGQEATCANQGMSVLFSPQLILQFKEGFQWFYCWENYTYTLQRIQRRSIIFRWGGGGGGGGASGVQLFSRGVQMLISIETHICTCYFPGGSVRAPYPPLDPYMGNVIITGQYLSQSGL